MSVTCRFQNLEIQSSILSERVLLLTAGNQIDPIVNRLIHRITAAIKDSAIPGIQECIPAYASLSIHFDPQLIHRLFPGHLPADAVCSQIFELITRLESDDHSTDTRLVEIPVWYNGADLLSLSDLHSLSPDEVIAIHCGVTYQVYMIGFLPGFAYMGSVDSRIATPRHPSPRQQVPSGSIAIAGMQTGIYPLESPGGWQLIGRTPVKLFDTSSSEPCLLGPGDQVRFKSISESEFFDLYGG